MQHGIVPVVPRAMRLLKLMAAALGTMLTRKEGAAPAAAAAVHMERKQQMRNSGNTREEADWASLRSTIGQAAGSRQRETGRLHSPCRRLDSCDRRCSRRAAGGQSLRLLAGLTKSSTISDNCFLHSSRTSCSHSGTAKLLIA